MNVFFYFLLMLNLVSCIFCIEPTACSKIKCQYYADCRVTGTLAQCVCPRDCAAQPLQRICGNDGQTYQNMCEMKQKSCQRKELVLKAYDGECGKLIVLRTN